MHVAALSSPIFVPHTQAALALLDDPLEWSAFSQHSRDCTPMATKHLSSGQVLRFRDYAHNFYFSRPEYLALVEREFGADARAQVVAMNTKTLHRDLLEQLCPAS